MKIQYLIVYIAAGAAFLAVSLWAFLSNGRSARAIRYKYKLGGIMLTAWAMMSAASCNGPGPTVTCYEPVVTCYDVAMEADVLSVTVKGYGGNRLKSGDVLEISIESPRFENYRCRITAIPENGDDAVLAVQDFTVADGKARFEMTLPPTEYKGAAKLTACGLSQTGEGTETEAPIGYAELVIL
ncbi:MAG: hypothetical protein J5737_04910 [Bacteroidales bacterium]|nr:hypothetical protein [Bacteroidales bacterium]